MPIPSCHTTLLQNYSIRYRDLADRIFRYVAGSEPDCTRKEKGSYSVDVRSPCAGDGGQTTAAKLVIFEPGKGSLSPGLHSLDPGVYIWVRSTDAIGERIWTGDLPSRFPALFGRMSRGAMIAVRPWDHVGFSYFRFEEDDSLIEISELLAACAGV